METPQPTNHSYVHTVLKIISATLLTVHGAEHSQVPADQLRWSHGTHR